MQRVQLWKGLHPSALSEAVSHFTKVLHCGCLTKLASNETTSANDSNTLTFAECRDDILASYACSCQTCLKQRDGDAGVMPCCFPLLRACQSWVSLGRCALVCLQSQKLQGKSSITRSGTMQTRADKACLDLLSRLDADLPMTAIHGASSSPPAAICLPALALECIVPVPALVALSQTSASKLAS